MSVSLYSLYLIFLVVCEVRCYNEEQNPTYMSASVGVKVAEKNLIEIPPTNQTAIEGEEANFECSPKDSALNTNWYKDGSLLSQFENLQNRYLVTENNTLVIRNITTSDHGEYECEIMDDNGDNQTAKASLDVQYRAKIVFAPPEILLRQGEPASIDCHFKANPPSTRLDWTKDGVPIGQYDFENVFDRKNGSLYITKTDERHNGRYTCTPFNDLGTEGPSPQMLVIVQRPPVFVVSPLLAYSRKAGEKVEMPCDAKHGDDGHKPVIIWSKKDGAALSGSRYTVKGGNLTIRGVEKGDEGTYQCSASNRIDTVTAETELLVEDSTINFQSITEAEASVDSIKLKWLPGLKRSCSKQFSVWYKAVGTANWEIRNVPSSATLEFTVSGLETDTEYEFMVMCMDQNEDGRFSKVIRVRTKGY